MVANKSRNTSSQTDFLELEHTPERKKNGKSEPQKGAIPTNIETRYYVRADMLGHKHVFADAKGAKEVFYETSKSLRTKLNDPHAVKLMIDTAAHREWETVKVKGTAEFRREAWLEGQARGIQVKGYSPSEMDKAALQKREKALVRSESLNENQPTKSRYSKDNSDDRQAPGQIRPNYKKGLEGILVEQGSKSYRDNPDNASSPYLVIKDDKGNQHTVWGVGLPDAMLKAGVKEGDRINLRETGMERIAVTILRDVDGEITRTEQEVERRNWMIESKNELKISEVSRSGQSKSPDPAEISRTVEAGEQSLHVGPARDAALENGAFANEERALAYAAGGRSVAGQIADLKGAATMEAYIERKLRQHFPKDPMAVERGVAIARSKISHAIAKGEDFPVPRVTKDTDHQQHKDADRQQNVEADNASRTRERKDPLQEKDR